MRIVEYEVEWCFNVEFMLDDEIDADSQEAKDLACEHALWK